MRRFDSIYDTSITFIDKDKLYEPVHRFVFVVVGGHISVSLKLHQYILKVMLQMTLFCRGVHLISLYL